MLQLLDLRFLYLKQTADNSFTATGDIRLMDEFEQKRNLVALYEYYGQTEALTRLLVTNYKEDYFKYIQDELDLYGGRPQAIELYRNRKFVNGTSSYRYFIGTCLRNYRDTEQRMPATWPANHLVGRLLSSRGFILSTTPTAHAPHPPRSSGSPPSSKSGCRTCRSPSLSTPVPPR